MVGSTVIRDKFGDLMNLVSGSTLVIPKVSYQDMGTYICEVENGIPGRNGQIAQRGHGFMSVTGSSRVINGREKYVTEKDVSLDINVTFISFPEPVNTSILRTDSSLPPQSDPTVSVSPVPVSVSFYNKDVIVDGYMAQIHFNKFEAEHQGHYQLYIRNSFEYTFNFKISISDKPDPPTSLMIGQITEYSANVSWIPGEDNGHAQKITLIHRDSTRRLETNVTLNDTVSAYTVKDLAKSTKYDVILYSSNYRGTSETITGSFTTKSGNVVMGTAIIGLTAGSAAAVILIMIVVVVVLVSRSRRRRQKPREDKSGDDDDGMKDNVLYESAGPNWSPQPGPSTQEQPGGAVYAVVKKPKLTIKIKETQGYAETNTPKKPVDDSAAYAEVQDPVELKTIQEPEKDWSGDDDDGMKDNVLYESAGPNWSPQPGPSTQEQPGGAGYAVVKKPKLIIKIKETQGYAETNTPKKPVDDSAAYAEVQDPVELKTIKEPEKDWSGDDDDGMKDNVLYESAGPNWSPQPGPSTQEQPGGAGYAVVKKPKLTIKIKETQGYAETNTPKKPVDDSAAYAEVQDPVELKTIKEPEKDWSGDDDDGMKDNVLYESAGPNWSPQPGPSTQEQPGGAGYAVVKKPKLTIKIKETQGYAETNTPKKPVDDSAAYAEVQDPVELKTIKEPEKDWTAVDNDGMKDNIVYESAGPNWSPKQGLGIQEQTSGYLYAEVKKTKEGFEEGTKVADASPEQG
ncbi:uncharacterized protein LOC117319296 isoform X2 [Pecten maximus]|uniref:uncharacterized protein LOC117319296 isoform X2 n=1 Tax=Pecten maximus TaxID=6579 RepID=UPI0014584B56|nr:uncharacterized protein LOC117319296 isoform X2 [Pecten maximus]